MLSALRGWRPATVALLCVVLAGCSTDASSSPPGSRSSRPSSPAPITLGVFGAPTELAAYERALAHYNDDQSSGRATLVEFDSAEQVADAVTAGADLPDVFLIDAADLPHVMDANANERLDLLLDERGVRFGDDYKRNALLALSAEGKLQCMPYNASPMVMFINTDLIDVQRLPEAGFNVPSRPYSWNLDQFEALLELASRPGRGIYGTHVESTLEGILPFVYASGISPYDDGLAPTSLNFSDPDLRAPLEKALAVLRRPRLTIPDSESLTALELFKAGRLATLPGYRELVPELRREGGLNFDVMPIPTNGASGTVMRLTALCISKDSQHLAQSADLLTSLLDPQVMGSVARSGYLVPSNSVVSVSTDFIQPLFEPAGAEVFNTAVRAVTPPPVGVDLATVSAAVNPMIQRMLHAAVLDLDELLPELDAASQTAFQTEP